MANTLINPDMIAKVALMNLENNCVLGNLFYREYENEWEGVKKGDSVRIRKPVKFIAGTSQVVGADYSSTESSIVQDVKESYITMTLDQWRSVPWKFNVKELTLDVDEYNERYILPASIQIVNEIEKSCAGLYVDIYNCGLGSSTGATMVPKTFKDVGKGALELNLCAVPPSPRSFVMDPNAQLELSSNFTTLSIPAIAGPALKEGEVSRIAGMPCYMGQGIKQHAAGALAAISRGSTACAILAATTSVWGTTYDYSVLHITTTGSTGGAATAAKVGDILYVTNVNSINPVGRDSNNVVQKFVIIEANSGVGSSTEMSLKVRPVLEVGSSTGSEAAYKTVTQYTTVGAKVTVIGDHTANLAFHKNAFALAMAKLDVPSSADFKAVRAYNGFAISITKGFDILKFEEIIRLDVLYGVKTLYSELAARVPGSS